MENGQEIARMYNEYKIKTIQIENFRGISKKVSLDLLHGNKPESLLIYGDNGTGKSSIIDAIELTTQGSVQSSSSTKEGSWLYSSISLATGNPTKINLEFENGSEYNILMLHNKEAGRVVKSGIVLNEFRKAPFVMRRKDILNFWDIPNEQKLKIFLRYINDNSEEMQMTEDELIDIADKERMELKLEKRQLINIIQEYYIIDFSEFACKGKGEFFKYIKFLNNDIALNKLNSSHPQYNNLRRLNEIFDEIGKLNKRIRKLRKQKTTVEGYITEKGRLQEVMRKIAPNVTNHFKIISGTNDYVKEIAIEVGSSTEVSIDFIVYLENGTVSLPTMLFSEANRDLLALLIYFEFIYFSNEYGQAKVLVLDDIFQSIDSTIRFKVMRYVVNRFKDWQIIITTHDRLWKEQLTQVFRNYSKIIKQMEILNWTFREGPKYSLGSNNYDDRLLKSIEIGSIPDICSGSGYLLEYICEKLSFILSTSIRRKPNDRYTIGDLWPGIYKAIKKTPASKVFLELNDLIHLRNLVGSHYNEWSLSLSRHEANDFGHAVLDTYYHVCCKKCGKWITSISDIQEEEFYTQCCD